MGRPPWQIKIITLAWPFREILARMAGWPVFRKWALGAFRGDRIHYIPVNVEVEKPQSIVLPGEKVRELIAASSFRFVLHRCICRTLDSCKNYPPGVGCMFLGDGAREIDQSLGKEVTVSEALLHYEKAAGLGLVPVMGRVRWDSIWLGVKRGDRLLTICYCCECCCYFRLYRRLPREAAAGLKKLEGLEVRINAECDGCGICLEHCFIQAMTLENGRAVPGESCRGCGRCAKICPRKAVRLVLHPARSQRVNFLEL